MKLEDSGRMDKQGRIHTPTENLHRLPFRTSKSNDIQVSVIFSLHNIGFKVPHMINLAKNIMHWNCSKFKGLLSVFINVPVNDNVCQFGSKFFSSPYCMFAWSVKKC